MRVACAEGQRLSYCSDCEVIKGRAQGRGFSVAQMCDAFERNGVASLFEQHYDFIVAGTRFDPTAAQWAAPPAGANAGPSLLAHPPPGVAPAYPDSDVGGADDGAEAEELVGAKRGGGGGEGGRGASKRRRVATAAAAAGVAAGAYDDEVAGEDELVGQTGGLTYEELATMRKRCALCKCAPSASTKNVESDDRRRMRVLRSERLLALCARGPEPALTHAQGLLLMSVSRLTWLAAMGRSDQLGKSASRDAC